MTYAHEIMLFQQYCLFLNPYTIGNSFINALLQSHLLISIASQIKAKTTTTTKTTKQKEKKKNYAAILQDSRAQILVTLKMRQNTSRPITQGLAYKKELTLLMG